MKSILLASASVLAFAGVASAQETPTGIIFGGDASFGFNSYEGLSDERQTDREDEGFFYEANLDVTLRAILDNGAVAESTFTIPVADSNLGSELAVDNDFLLGLSIEGVGAIQLGDTTFAAEDNFDFATMQSADFSEQDAETTVKGNTTFGSVTVAASAIVLDGDGDEPGDRLVAEDERDYIDQISLGAAGDVGRFTFSFGYQEESDVYGPGNDDETGDDSGAVATEGTYDPEDSNGDFNPAEQFGVSVGTNFAGFDVQFGYGQNLSGADADLTDGFNPEQTRSYGLSAGFPVGPVTLTAEYVFEPDAEAYGSDTEYSYAIGAQYSTDRFIVDASFGEEIGEEEYDIKVGYAIGEITTIQAGYNDDDGGFVAYRQGLGAGAFVEASFAESEDSGFGNSDFGGVGLPDDIREGTTLKVGLEF